MRISDWSSDVCSSDLAIPCVPAQGSVGASGDLAPLAHLSAAMLGQGRIALHGEIMPAAEALQRLELEPLALGPKEGLALINGTQVSTALAFDAFFAGERAFAPGPIAGGLLFGALQGPDEGSRGEAWRGERGGVDL